jgi:hypothetical protein
VGFQPSAFLTEAWLSAHAGNFSSTVAAMAGGHSFANAFSLSLALPFASSAWTQLGQTKTAPIPQGS